MTKQQAQVDYDGLFGDLENARSSWNAEVYSQLCDELGVEPLDNLLYEQGCVDRNPILQARIQAIPFAQKQNKEYKGPLEKLVDYVREKIEEKPVVRIDFSEGRYNPGLGGCESYLLYSFAGGEIKEPLVYEKGDEPISDGVNSLKFIFSEYCPNICLSVKEQSDLSAKVVFSN